MVAEPALIVEDVVSNSLPSLLGLGLNAIIYVMDVEKDAFQEGREPAIYANQAETFLDPHRNHYGACGKFLHLMHSQIHAKSTFPTMAFWPLRQYLATKSTNSNI